MKWNESITSNKQDKYYKAIVIGDSTGNAAFMPEAISDSMINLSILGTGPIEGYYVLKEYLENNEAPEACFVCYYESHFNNMDVYWEETVKDHRFSMEDNLEIINNATEEVAPTIFSAFSKYLAYETYFPSKYMVSIQSMLEDKRAGIDRSVDNEAAVEKAALHGGRYAYIGNQVFETVQMREYSEMAGKQIYIDYMNKIIELCETNDIDVHIVKAPMPDNTIMTDQYIANVNDFYGYFVDNYDNVTFDWSDKIYEARYFAEETHLNNDGAYRFSTHIKEQHPELFSDEDASKHQMLAMDDNIQMENMPEDLFTFVNDRDYTLLIYNPYDGMDQLLSQFNVSDIEYNKLDTTSPIYECNTGAEAAEGYTISEEEGSVVVQLDKSGESARWSFPTNNSIGILVIDNINNKVVAIKNIEYYGADGYSKWFN